MNYKIGTRKILLINIFAIFLTVILSFSSQADDSIDYKNSWEKYINNGDTIGSMLVFKELFRKEPDKMDISYAYAQLLAQTGNYKEAAKVLIKGFYLCEWGPSCEPALADLSFMVEYLDDLADIEKMLEKRLANNHASWIEISLVRDLLKKVYVAQEKFEEAEKLAVADNYIGKWLIIGPFGNRNQQEFLVGGSIEKEFSELDLNKEWQGRGRQIGWQEIKVPWNGTANLGRVLYPGDEIITYALTYLNVTQDMTAVLALEQSGASALWLNNQLLYVDSAYVQGEAPLQRLIEVELKKGVNQVVIKLAGGRGILPQLRFRALAGSVEMLDDAGSYRKIYQKNSEIKYSIKDGDNQKYIESDNNRKKYAFAKFPKIKQGESWGTAGILWGALSYYEEIAGKNELSYQNALALMNTGFLVDVYGFDSTEYLRKKFYTAELLKKYPHCPLFMIIAAYIESSDNQKLALLQEAAASSKDDVVAQEGIVNLLLNTGFKEQAWKKAEEMAADGIGLFTANSVQARIAEAEKWYPEAENYFREVTKYYPGSGWGYAKRAINSTSAKEAVKILEQGRNRVFDINLAEALASWLYKAQQFKMSAAIYEKILFLSKYNEGFWDGAAAVQVALGDFANAAVILEKGISWMPQSPALLENLGRVLLRSGKSEEGLGYLRQALFVQADNPDLVAYIKELSQDEEEFYSAENITFNDLAGRNATAEMYPGFDQLILLDQKYVAVAENATKKEMVHIVKKVLRESAVGRTAEHGIYYDRSRQKVEVKYARVIQPSGQVNENPVIRDLQYNTGYAGASAIYDSAQIKSIRLSGVKEGSIVDIMYTIEDTAANIYHDKFSEIHYLGAAEPVVDLRYTVEVPKAFGLKYAFYKSNIQPVISEIDGEKLRYNIKVSDIAGIKAEVRMPPLEEILPAVTFSSYKDWQSLGYWAEGLFAPAMDMPEDIKEKVREIVKGVDDREGKIAAIYNYVTKNIRYVSISYGRFGYTPHKVERTFRSGYGDCKDTAALLVAMLREVGIEAYPTLVRTRDRGKIVSALPGPEIFNHSIAYVPAVSENDKHYWLDGTTDYFRLSMIPGMDRGTESLIIKDKGELLRIDSLQASQQEVISNITFTVGKEGKGGMQGKEVYKGRSAIELQSNFERPEQFFNYFKRFLNSRYAGADIGGFDYASSVSGKAESWFTYSVDSDSIAVKDGSSLKLYPWLFPFNLTNVTALKSRNYDLLLGYPRIMRNVVEIVLEDGVEIEYAPEAFKKEIEGVVFERKVDKIKSGIRLITSLTINATRIKTEDYQEFKEFVNMISARAEEVVFIRE